MASSDHLTRLKAIRDQLEAELADETARRAALVAAGNPAPATYSVGGKSISWTEYLTGLLGQIKDLNELIIASGADDGGIPEASIVMW